MRTLILITILSISTCCFGQQQKDYLISVEDTTNIQKFRYAFINQRGDTITRLDTSKYYHCFSDTVRHFAIVGIVNKKGWWAIDRNENLLFQVFNTSSGEPSPDELKFGMIRIIDDSGKLGFANEKGEVVIKPQFEAASRFYNDKAIIGKQCKQVLWCCQGENEDKHYVTECKQTGYIDRKGKVQKIANVTFEQMQKLIGWQAPD
jgi:WG containing repeat